jgi:chemotaxis protein MotC
MRAPAAFLTLIAALPATPAWAASDLGKTPYQLVRSLRVAQDKALFSSKRAMDEQRKRIVEIGGVLAKLDLQAWQDPRNARAAVIYVLSGGDPTVLRRLIAAEKLGIDAAIVNAALAYGEHRDEQALELFADIDMNQIDQGLIGHVALVQGLLVADKSPEKAMRFLDLARISSAGTIVEEAALRQEAAVAGNKGELEKFQALASQYFRRFGGSIYARSFARQFAAEVIERNYAEDSARQAKLEAMLRQLSVAQRRELCLLIGEEGIAKAKVEMVRFAARIAAIDAKEDPEDAVRLKLFNAAASVVTKNSEQALSDLASIDRSMLTPRQEGLVDAALAVAREVRRPPAPVSRAPEAAQGEPALSPSAKLIGQADAAIARADKLLSETVR